MKKLDSVSTRKPITLALGLAVVVLMVLGTAQGVLASRYHGPWKFPSELSPVVGNTIFSVVHGQDDQVLVLRKNQSNSCAYRGEGSFFSGWNDRTPWWSDVAWHNHDFGRKIRFHRSEADCVD